APTAGFVGRRAVRVGAYVNAGSSLMAVVPLRSIYIVGNFREIQLTHVRTGQPVDIVVDAFPGLRLKGSVDSVAPATGLTFSAITPDNATGNFTKIAQRLPVKIKLDTGQADVMRLRVGMSVLPKIDTSLEARVKG
uniref:HlyD family secretion protein n=1 Tax=Rugamonas sp. TaxID=1926287 RepID=UPI0025EDB6E6